MIGAQREDDGRGRVGVDEQAVLRLARRRGLGRRIAPVAVPVVLVGWYVAARWDDGPPALAGVLAVLALTAAVAAGWWWLERGARGPGAGPTADRVRPAHLTAEDLRDARAELALRTCAAPPEGARTRVAGLADRWCREGLFGLWLAPLFLAVAVLLVVTGGPDDARGVPWPLVALWAAVAVALLCRSVHRRRLAVRWLVEHGTAPEVAGPP